MDTRIGVDLGGTNIAAAAVDSGGLIVSRVSVPTNAGAGAGAVMEGLLKVCGMIVSDTGCVPESVGIGVPGTVNTAAGEVIFTPNLPVSGVNITDAIRKKLGCPVYLGNDANCAALGEATAGSARGVHCAVMITLGTGLGGGVVVGGKLHTGLSGAAGELGHMVISAGGRRCGCGRLGCWETYASATGLVVTALEAMKSHDSGIMSQMCAGDTSRLDGRLIFKASRVGDKAACIAVAQYISHLAEGIANIINILEPDVICVGGGISQEWNSIEKPLLAAVNLDKYTSHSENVPSTRIVRAELGNDAGIIGAAMLGIL
ncbi:MAG: ROK family protein [Oscillospiraceae bacterium]|nr:ROK family protein [Oscillospiraceae bacterium]